MAGTNWPFTLALAIVILLGVVEVVGLMLGGASSFFDNDVAGDVAVDVGSVSVDGANIDGANVDASPDADGLGGLSDGAIGRVLDWLHVGQMPSTILLIVFLTAFGGGGLLLQTAIKAQSGAMLPTLLVSGIAFFIALPTTRMVGGVMKRLLPSDESQAVSRDSFVGCEAQIMVGTSRRGKPAEARLRDKFGRSHYVMVEPEDEDASFPAGHQVLILKRNGDTFRAVDNAHGILE